MDFPINYFWDVQDGYDLQFEHSRMHQAKDFGVPGLIPGQWKGRFYGFTADIHGPVNKNVYVNNFLVSMSL